MSIMEVCTGCAQLEGAIRLSVSTLLPQDVQGGLGISLLSWFTKR